MIPKAVGDLLGAFRWAGFIIWAIELTGITFGAFILANFKRICPGNSRSFSIDLRGVLNGSLQTVEYE